MTTTVDDVPGQMPMFAPPTPPKPAKAKLPHGMVPKYVLDAPDGRLYVGDANVVMPGLANAGMACRFDMAFMDPPFNIGHEYGEDFTDKVDEEKYRLFTRQYVVNAVRLLRPGGTLWMHLPSALAPYAFVHAKAAGMHHRRTIILHQEFGQYGEGNFIASHVQLLYFTKPGGPHTWNVPDILEPSQRLKDGDARVATAKHKGMRPMLDVWYGENLGRVQGNNDERWGHMKRRVPGNGRGKIIDVDGMLSDKARKFTHPNQLPELYMARIVRCSTSPGDTVFEGFTGSGTGWAVARALGRRWYGSELTDYIAESAHARVKYRGAVRDVKGVLHNAESKV